MITEATKADQTRQRILESAVQEFALQGYSKASTNHMVEQAGIAKGLLFHYFTNKQKLYLVCLDMVMQDIQKPLDSFMQKMPSDLFLRLEAFLAWKQDFSRQQPEAFRFLMSMTKLPPELHAKAEEKLSAWRENNRRLLQDYDLTPWASSINHQDALAVIVFLFDAIDQKWLQQMDAGQSPDPNAIFAHARRMLSVLKTGFYQKNNQR